MASSKTVTLAKYGLTAALGAAASLTITTLTATTANITTAEILTLSGGTLRTTAGDTVINGSGVETIDTLSGSYLQVKPRGTSTGGLLLDGPADGVHICIQDTDGAGWTMCDALNGTLTCRTTTDALMCPAQS